MTEQGGVDRDAHFYGAVPDLYERLLVPMIFREPALSLARLVAGLSPQTVLETAAGTGALTRALHSSCPSASITATDLNQPMIDVAAADTGDVAGVAWRRADALDLPFDDDTFDVVACQFGVMFFPDRGRGHLEASRVLRPGGTYVFSTWDRIENNEVAHVIQSALLAVAPSDPLEFMGRVPHGYWQTDRIVGDLHEAGLPGATVTAKVGRSRTSAVQAAIAFCQGTPLRTVIEGQGVMSLAEATGIAERALVHRFGSGPIDGATRWFEVVVATPVADG
ncbi:MAG: methyltransferase domain-containing protein [Aeromicrobium sp.]